MRRLRWRSPWWRWGFLALAALWVGYATTMAWQRGPVALDDFYITFRFAQNFIEGHGLVFNPGERVFGTTAPGYALLLGLLGLPGTLSGVAVPYLANALTALSVVLIAVLLLLENRHRWPEVALGGTLLVTSGFVWTHGGAELPVSLALMVLAAHRGERRPVLAGVLAALAVACRPDAGLAVAILGLLLWRQQRRLPWRFGWAAAAGIALGLLAAQAWFGQPLPATLEAKRFQGEWSSEIWASGSMYWVQGLAMLRRQGFGEGLTVIAASLAGLIPLLRHGGRGLRMVALYGLAVAVAYPLLGVPFYGWYAEATVIALLYGLSFLLGSVARAVYGFFQPARLSGVLAAAVAGLLAVTLLSSLATHGRGLWRADWQGGRFGLYREVGEWLREHSQPGEAVSYVEVGILAYYSQRPINDLVGLVSPQNLEDLRHHRSPERLLRQRPTPLVIYAERVDRLLGPVCEAPWFAEHYEEVQRFRLQATGEVLIVYRRRS